MDVIAAAVLDMWWMAPAAVAGGAVAVGAARYGRSGRGLGVAVARHALREAMGAERRGQLELRARRAEARRLSTERAGAERIGAARLAVKDAERAVRAANARVRERRAQLAVEQSARGGSELPLARLRREHDELRRRWLDYETDPAKAIAYPRLSDGRIPETAAFLTAAEHASECERVVEGGRITAAQFSAYQDAVAETHRALDHAERAARGEKLAAGPAWQDGAQELWDKSAEAFERASDAARDAVVGWMRRRKASDDADDR